MVPHCGLQTCPFKLALCNGLLFRLWLSISQLSSWWKVKASSQWTYVEKVESFSTPHFRALALAFVFSQRLTRFVIVILPPSYLSLSDWHPKVTLKCWSFFPSHFILTSVFGISMNFFKKNFWTCRKFSIEYGTKLGYLNWSFADIYIYI